MPYLALDTSTEYLSLAITTSEGVIGRNWHVGQKHAEQILPRLDELLTDCNITMQHIKGVAFGNGPGSFTGLRIGCGIAQGLAFACGIPVLGVCTLEAMAQGAQADKVIVCLDARMNQVYTASYIRSGSDWQLVNHTRVCNPDEVPVPEGDHWMGIGNGFAQYGALLAERLGARLIAVEPDRFPNAIDILTLSLPRFAGNLACPAQDAELVYLRDKVALKTHERVAP